MTSESAITGRRRPCGRTGPRSCTGKRRVRANPLRHGLAVTFALDPGLPADIERLASALANGNDPRVRAYAAQIAEAELALLRVRQAKLRAIEAAASSGGQAGAQKGAALLRLAIRLLDPQIAKEPPTPATLASWQRDLAAATSAGAADASPEDRIVAGFAAALPELGKLDRYERRAYSRRRRAASLLMAALTFAGVGKTGPTCLR